MSGAPRGDEVAIAYLSNLYPYATDTFVRIEVEFLRRSGFAVHPFSIKRPGPELLVDDRIRAEHGRTTYLYGLSLAWRGPLALLREAIRSPARALRAVRLMWSTTRGGMRMRGASYLLEAAVMAGALHRLGVRHVHNHIGESSASVAMLASELSGIPYSLTIHGPYVFFAAEQWALGEKIRRSAFTACITEFCRSQCMIFAPREAWERLRVVHCSLGPVFLAEEPPPIPPRPRFVTVGRIAPAKGMTLLVDAVRQLRDLGVDAELVIVGDGEGRAEVEALAHSLGVADRVTVTGWMDSSSVRKQIEGARALVMASFAEGLPMVVMEALALGRPVIAPRIAGIPELVEPGADGWLVTPSSAGELASAMRAAIELPERELEALGREGRRRVLERHDAEIEIARLAGHIRSCIDTGAPLPADPWG